jgi:hypothetical protein
MEFSVPIFQSAALLRPEFHGGAPVLIVNQDVTDAFMSDVPGELDAVLTGFPQRGGVRIASGGQILWPKSETVAWFRGISAWMPTTPYGAAGQPQAIIDKLGGLWKATTAGTSGALYPFPAAEPAIGTTQADGTVTWTFQGPAAPKIEIQAG